MEKNTIKKSVAKKPKKPKKEVEKKLEVVKKVKVTEKVRREKLPALPQISPVSATGDDFSDLSDMAAEFEKTDDANKPERYWEAVGRRKKAVARVRLYTRGEKNIIVNEMPHGKYFNTKEQQKLAEDSLQKMKSTNRFRVSAHVSGGGLKAQAEAIRHGVARALVKFNPDFRKRLRKAGFLTRDPRMKERKKFGLKGARRRPQWAKR